MLKRMIVRSVAAFCLSGFVCVVAGCQSGTAPLPLAQVAPEAPALAPSNYELADAGTVFVWRDLDSGRIVEETVLDHQGRLMRANYGTRNSFAYVPHPWADNENTTASDVEPIFPLEIGKKITLNRQPPAGRTSDSIEVLRTETLMLPFGAVDTYVIESRSRLVGGSWEGRATVWYAPSLRWQVQWEITDNEGDNRRRQVIEVK